MFGVAVFFFDLGLHLAGGQALMRYLDAVELFKLVAGSLQVFFLAGAVNNQLAIFLGGSDQIGVDLALRDGEGHESQQHSQGQEYSKQFLHDMETSFKKY